MGAHLTHKFVRSLPWAAGEAFFNSFYGLLTVLVIGRFIAPVELGAASTAIAIVFLIEVLSSAGLQEAVVRSRSADTIVTDTAFVMAMGFSLAGAAICVPAAFLAAAVFGDHRLTFLTLAASLTLPLNALGTVPSAVLTRKMRAGVLTRRMVGGKTLGLIVLSSTAAFGFGPWSLILAGLATSAGSLVMILTATSRWPRLRFAPQEARPLLRFGAMVSAENSLHIISLRAFSLLFGYFHGLAALGNFQLALRLTEEVGALVIGAVNRFGLSFFAGKERSAADMRSAFLTGSKLITAGAAPLFGGIALVAKDFIPLMFGSQWQDSIPFLQIIAISWIVVFQRILIGLVLRARGQQKILVSLAASAAAFALIACVATAAMPAIYGVIGFASRRFFNAPFVTFAVRRHLKIPFKEQFSNVFAPTAAAAVMAAAVIAFQLLLAAGGPAIRLSGSILIGVAAYAVALWLLSPSVVALAQSVLLRYKMGG